MSLARRVAPIVMIIAWLPAAPAGAQEAQAFEGWGDVVNPDRDCRFGIEAGEQTFLIRVPAKPHLLSAEVRKLRMNAPRVLRAVRGDFEARVKVVGELRPGAGATSQYAPYQGAGLLLWQDAKNYVRLERAVHIKDGASLAYVNYEQRKDGRLAASQGFATAAGPLLLRLGRRGGEVIGAYSAPGEPPRPLPPLAAALPDALKVGILAVNAADNPLDAAFQGFEVELKEPPAPAGPPKPAEKAAR